MCHFIMDISIECINKSLSYYITVVEVENAYKRNWLKNLVLNLDLNLKKILKIKQRLLPVLARTAFLCEKIIFRREVP